MPIVRDLICSSHTISGVMPGDPVPARHGFEARVAACAAAGYRGLFLHIRDYRALRQAGHDDEALAATLRRHGFHNIGLEFLTDWFLEGDAGSDGRLDEATAYEAAHAYGAHTLNVGADFQGRGIAAGAMRTHFRNLCERAGEHGLKVALEIVPWSNVRNVDTALEMIDGAPDAGLVIDSWHIFRGGIALEELEHIPGERILCIQINDAGPASGAPLQDDTRHRKLCGDGIFDLAGLLTSLDKTGTLAPVSVEIISPEQASLDVGTAARGSFDSARYLFEPPLRAGDLQKAREGLGQ